MKGAGSGAAAVVAARGAGLYYVGQRGGGLGAMPLSREIKHLEPAFAPGDRRGPVAGGVVLVVLVLYFLVRSPEPVRTAAGPVPEGRPAAPAQAAPMVAEHPMRPPMAGRDDPAGLGPSGAFVDVMGQVVGVHDGAAVVDCQGSHYLVLKGEGGEPPRAGDRIRVTGRVLGSSDDGLFYVEGGTAR